MAVKAGYVRDEDRNVEAVVIVDEPSQDTIEIQNALEYEEGDAEQGWDTYCVVRSGVTHYGGVRSFTHEADSVTFEFTDEAARVLELPTLVTIQISADQLEPVLPVLERLLG